MNKNKFKIYTLGCKVNQYDSFSLARQLKSIGFDEVKVNADLAIINTCAVTKTAIHKDKRAIARAKKENPNAKIVIVGCGVKIYQKEFNDLDGDLILDEIDIKKIVNFISDDSLKEKIEPKEKIECQIIFNPHHARYFIKIQDGCEQFCSYCIIPYARGKLKSRDEQEVLDEIKKVVQAGYQEIVLCGIHLGLYGKDFEQGSLVDILKKIIDIKRLGRVRLSSIEINEINNELLELMKNNPKICPHLHIPLQAGCDKILKLMNRPYNISYFKKRLKTIRKIIPDIAITTDVIVGFPGETNKDFKRTYKFIKKIKFSRLHVFSFSPHEKTPAAKMANQINNKIIKERSDKLRELGKKLEEKYKKKFSKKELNILVEHISDKGVVRGHSENYLDISFKKESKIKVGEIVKKKL